MAKNQSTAGAPASSAPVSSAPAPINPENAAPAAPITNPSTGEAPAEPMIQVPAVQLKTLLDRLESLEKVASEHESTFDQDQMQRIERLRASGKLVKKVRINFFDGKIVLAYKTTHDDVYVDNTGKVQETQRMRLEFDGGQTVEIPSVEFFRRKTQGEYEVIREARENDGRVMMTLMLEGGRELTIDANYVN